MKLTINRENLLKTASLVGQAVSQKPQLPVLNHFLLKASKGVLELKATNLETTIQAKLAAKVDQEGETTLPARLLVEYCQMSKEELVTLEAAKESVILTAGKTKANLVSMDVNEFPQANEFEEEANFTIGKKVFTEAVSSVSFCASFDEGRPTLSAVLVKGDGKNITFVATDGYRLAKKEIKATDKVEALVPARALQDALKALSEQEDDEVVFSLEKGGNQIRLQTKNLLLTSRLIEGVFPSYEQIIPSSFPSKISTETQALIDSIKLTALFARDVGNVVRFEQKEDLKISATTAQLGDAQSQVSAKTEGDDIVVAFNSKFLLDALGSLNSKEAEISFSGTTSAALIKGEDSSLSYIIMPVRVQG